MFERFNGWWRETKRELEYTFDDIKKDRHIYETVAILSWSAGVATSVIVLHVSLRNYAKVPKGAIYFTKEGLTDLIKHDAVETFQHDGQEFIIASVQTLEKIAKGQ